MCTTCRRRNPEAAKNTVTEREKQTVAGTSSISDVSSFVPKAEPKLEGPYILMDHTMSLSKSGVAQLDVIPGSVDNVESIPPVRRIYMFPQPSLRLNFFRQLLWSNPPTLAQRLRPHYVGVAVLKVPQWRIRNRASFRHRLDMRKMIPNLKNKQ